MIYEYHHLRVMLNIGKPSYYIPHLVDLGALQIVYQTPCQEYTDVFIKTSNLRFRQEFRKYSRDFSLLLYIRQIQKYNYKAERKLLKYISHI